MANMHQKRVLILRTHYQNDFIEETYFRLKQAAPQNVEVFICLDDTVNKVGFPGYVNVVNHSTETIKDLDLLPFMGDRMMWYCGDYALYAFYCKKPNYDFYVMVENDVYFPDRQLEVFFEILSTTNSDYLGLRVSKAFDNWKWTHTAKHYFSDVYHSFFPIVGLSNEAVRLCINMRREHSQKFTGPKTSSWPYCEAFVPSVVKSAGLRILDLEGPLKTRKLRTNLYCSEFLSKYSADGAILHSVLPPKELVWKMFSVSDISLAANFFVRNPHLIHDLRTFDQDWLRNEAVSAFQKKNGNVGLVINLLNDVLGNR